MKLIVLNIYIKLIIIKLKKLKILFKFKYLNPMGIGDWG